MSTIEEIQQAISRLSDSDRRKIVEWLEELDDAQWDRQIESNGEAGKLKEMLREADADIQAHRYTDV